MLLPNCREISALNPNHREAFLTQDWVVEIIWVIRRVATEDGWENCADEISNCFPFYGVPHSHPPSHNGPADDKLSPQAPCESMDLTSFPSPSVYSSAREIASDTSSDTFYTPPSTPKAKLITTPPSTSTRRLRSTSKTYNDTGNEISLPYVQIPHSSYVAPMPPTTRQQKRLAASATAQPAQNPPKEPARKSAAELWVAVPSPRPLPARKFSPEVLSEDGGVPVEQPKAPITAPNNSKESPQEENKSRKRKALSPITGGNTSPPEPLSRKQKKGNGAEVEAESSTSEVATPQQSRRVAAQKNLHRIPSRDLPDDAVMRKKERYKRKRHLLKMGLLQGK